MSTRWQTRVASFEEAVRTGWREHRLVPWLFERAGRTEQVPSAVQAFGGTDLFPSQWFADERQPSIDGMGREWGAHIAREETVALLTRVSASCATEPATEQLAEDVDHALRDLPDSGLAGAAIFVPARWRILTALALEPGGDLAWVPGAGARRLFRGTFAGVPVFALPRAGATDIWVIDFGRIGTWQYTGAFDDLATQAELLRDGFVILDDGRVPATRITAEEFFAIEIGDVSAAHGIRVPLEQA